MNAEFAFDLADRLARDVRLDRVETPLRTKRHADPLRGSFVLADTVGTVGARRVASADIAGDDDANVAKYSPGPKREHGVQVTFRQIRYAQWELRDAGNEGGEPVDIACRPRKAPRRDEACSSLSSARFRFVDGRARSSAHCDPL
jgi:hypothetical protein